MTTFAAFVVDNQQGVFQRGVASRTLEQLPEGEVTIQVAYSSVNYKDGLAAVPGSKIINTYPFIPGIDLAGTVEASLDARYKPSDQVLVTGYGLGVSHAGGFSQLARVPADWIVPLPQGMSLRQAMQLGTAGFTAALSAERLQQHGLQPQEGPVLVTGATGGVGSLAVAMLAACGYEVAASTGKADEHSYLRELGAAQVLDRAAVTSASTAPLGKQRWAAAIDTVGGSTLAHVIRTTRYGGAVAACGMAGGSELPLTVYPFILRGVSLLGIDSVACGMETRLAVWGRLAANRRLGAMLDGLTHEVTLSQLPETLDAILHGQLRGRTLVKL